MSSKNGSNREKSSSNPNLKSSIVHKPFATGTINIFNPYRSKSSSQLSTPTDKDLESAQPTLPSVAETDKSEYWLDSLANPWSICAIAIIFLANLVSGAAIWRNYRLSANSVEESESALSSVDLAAAEFIPLNLSTLSRIETVEEIPEQSLTPIAPAQAPFNHLATSSSDPEYYYVLTEYAGDRSVSRAREKVKQVALVNLPQGLFIYLGAFTTKEQADEFVAQLQQENSNAHIYPLN